MTVSLRELFRRARLKDEEFALLEEALKRSDELVKLEKRAFAAFEGLYDDGAGNFTVPGKPNRERAIELLFGREYLGEKAAVIEPVQQFMDLFSGRMRTQADFRAGPARAADYDRDDPHLYRAACDHGHHILHPAWVSSSLWLNSAAR